MIDLICVRRKKNIIETQNEIVKNVFFLFAAYKTMVKRSNNVKSGKELKSNHIPKGVWRLICRSVCCCIDWWVKHEMWAIEAVWVKIFIFSNNESQPGRSSNYECDWNWHECGGILRISTPTLIEQQQSIQFSSATQYKQVVKHLSTTSLSICSFVARFPCK